MLAHHNHISMTLDTVMETEVQTVNIMRTIKIWQTVIWCPTSLGVNSLNIQFVKTTMHKFQTFMPDT